MNQFYPDLAALPVPRYTSYPTAAQFTESVGAAEQGKALAGIRPGTPVSLYLHIPFCRQICWYCGCNTGIASPDRLRRYVKALGHEIDTVSGQMAGHVQSIQFGGGSPNALDAATLAGIIDRLRHSFDVANHADIGVELDPRAVTPDLAPILAAAGVNRISLGVQTFAPHVQAKINRIQPFETIAATVRDFRTAGIEGINFDLMYGLPGQSVLDVTETIEKALQLAPARVAMFGYAHMPRAIARQRMIADADLPSAAARFAMAAAANRLFVQAGYVAIGFDHFAQAHDELAVAARTGQLARNFQGYACHPGEALVGLGSTAISQFADVIVQNEKHLGTWEARVNAGQLAGARGVAVSADDRARGAVIEQLLCRGAADVPPALAGAVSGLAPYAARGLVAVEGARVALQDAGWPYARLIAAAFDAHLKSPHRHAQAV
jgi:oxygen-independent coproporphyrinogen-3 oxidase